LEGVDIGFALLPDYERQGYGFEAADRIKQFALEDLAMPTIQGITAKENMASQNLLKKLGFQLEGVVNLPNDPEELFLFKYHA
jgi:RimJ/RimL family protein N-acetyltransferase